MRGAIMWSSAGPANCGNHPSSNLQQKSPGPNSSSAPSFFELSRNVVPLGGRLVLVELQTKFQLLDRLIGGLDGFHAVATEVMGGVFHVRFRPAQGFERLADFWLLFRWSRRGPGGPAGRRRCRQISLVRRGRRRG